MSLESQLKTLRDGAADRLPPAVLSVMHRVTAELIDSGIASRAVGPGDQMPSFELPDHRGEPVSSSALLARGPLVVTFYRGIW